MILLAACQVFTGAALASPRQDWTGNVNLALGSKMLNDDWEPVDEQTSFGLMLDARRAHWPLNLAADLFLSWDDDEETVFIPGTGVVSVDVKGKTTELNLGVRKLWEGFAYVNGLTPYVGAGVAAVWAEQEVDGPNVDEEEDGIGVGLWAGGGAYFTLVEHFNLGVDVRYSHTTDVDLFEDVNAGGFRASFLAGYHW